MFGVLRYVAVDGDAVKSFDNRSREKVKGQNGKMCWALDFR